MENKDLVDELHQIIILLHYVRDVTYRARDMEVGQYGITGTQSAVLDSIKAIQGSGERLTIRKLAKRLLREHHTISRVLVRMEKDGLISRIKDSGKKYDINVVLTEKGEQVYKQTLKREVIQEIMGCLSEEERSQLKLTLQKLLEKAFQYV